MASRVMSSSVGPSPPVHTISSTDSIAPASTRASSSTSSPITTFIRTSPPMAFSRSVITRELVSTRNGVSISLPTAMMHAFMNRYPSPDPPTQREHRAERDVGIDRGHEVVGHHAHSTRQLLEPVGGIRFDDVEESEQKESRDRAEPAHGVHEERDQHPHDLVDHNGSRISRPEVLLRQAARPGAPREHHDDDGGLNLD